MDEKVAISFIEISKAMHEFPFPKIDVVVGIGSGGAVPACLVAHQLRVPIVMASVNYRNEDNKPIRESPEFLKEFVCKFPKGFRLLLVDDVSVTGKTMELVKAMLWEYNVHTFVLKGKADLVLLPTIKSCVQWPWHTVPNLARYES